MEHGQDGASEHEVLETQGLADMRHTGSRTVTVGSQAWCDYWAQFYWERACKYADRAMKYPEQEQAYTIFAMEDMFSSYYWEERQPWAKEDK
jgi:hypothetical protein